VVDNIADVITESNTSLTQIDTVEVGFSYALGSNVENLLLTGVGDINGAGNTLNNSLTGNSGNNILNGGTGTDVLNGGLGNDTLIGAAGNDTFVFDSALDATSNNDTISDFIIGQDIIQLNKHIFTSLASLDALSTDNFRSSSNGLALDSDDYILYNTFTGALFYDADGNGAGDAVQFATLTTKPALSAADISVINTAVGIVLDGNFDNNYLDGGDGDDTLNGYGGHDTLNGYGGNDTMVGGTGDDSYYVDAVGDLVVENDGEGNDFVLSYISYTLGANLENLHLDPDSTADLNGTGNTIDNTIWGNSGANILDGGDGGDFLDGGQGNDTMIGGTGDDSFWVDAVGDLVIENDGEGVEHVYSDISYTLGANLENLLLCGTTDLNGTGNTLDNWICGNSWANIIDGGNGDDLLDGGQGSDTMLGGAGNDNYYVDAVGDMAVENAGEGYDSVFVRVSYILGANLEDLSLKGTGGGIWWYGVECTVDINGTGNSLNNYIQGNNGNNILDGGDGDDAIAGGLGNDTLTGGVGNDTFVFDTALNATSNIDTISDFTAGLDKIQVDNDIFTSLTATGGLLADYFKSSDTGLASDGNDYFLYNTTSGALFYDADGNGAGVAVQFATLTSKPEATANDFLVVF
jgi:serralysin